MKVAVIGGGISGLSTARLLNDKGHIVTVYEKEGTPGGCYNGFGHIFRKMSL